MDAHIAALARAAGLDKALAEFPDDVAAAAAQALNNAHAIQIPTDPAAEPWPPMRPGVGLGDGPEDSPGGAPGDGLRDSSGNGQRNGQGGAL